MANNPFDDDNTAGFDPEEELEIDAVDPTPLLPKGIHPAVVSKVEQTYTSNDNPAVIWTFTTVAQPIRGKRIQLWTVQTPNAMWKLTSVLMALGFKNENGKIRFKPAEAVGRKCLIETIMEKYEGRDQSKVKNVHPHPEGWAKMDIPSSDSPL